MAWLSLPRRRMRCGWFGRIRRGWRAMVSGKVDSVPNYIRMHMNYASPCPQLWNFLEYPAERRFRPHQPPSFPAPQVQVPDLDQEELGTVLVAIGNGDRHL